jgi:hypothetical protein
MRVWASRKRVAARKLVLPFLESTMLRKLIVLAITSGLAKKAWDVYRARHTGVGVPVAGTAPLRPAAPPVTPNA